MTGDNPPDAPGELTRFIETRYHEKHRAQLPGIAALSDKVEAVHAGHEGVPAGLADVLRKMIGDLEVHMKKEELILFPAIRQEAKGLDAPITVMRADHDDHAGEIARIRQLTGDLTLPGDACRSWTRLYAELGDFLNDLENHIRLENDVLFPQFETGAAGHG
ncbi:MAG: hemerythrin domain-containing protein [Rhodobiaceae bacterium]|nr:hemerythrin domain-containing protein [Rhodobiaceae bacterium]